jgi:hypothetical protein
VWIIFGGWPYLTQGREPRFWRRFPNRCQMSYGIWKKEYIFQIINKKKKKIYITLFSAQRFRTAGKLTDLAQSGQLQSDFDLAIFRKPIYLKNV